MPLRVASASSQPSLASREPSGDQVPRATFRVGSSIGTRTYPDPSGLSVAAVIVPRSVLAATAILLPSGDQCGQQLLATSCRALLPSGLAIETSSSWMNAICPFSPATFGCSGPATSGVVGASPAQLVRRAATSIAPVSVMDRIVRFSE